MRALLLAGLAFGSALGAEEPQVQVHWLRHTFHHELLPSASVRVLELRWRTRGWTEDRFNLAWNCGIAASLGENPKVLSEPGGFGGATIIRGRYTYRHDPSLLCGFQATYGDRWQGSLLVDLRLARTEVQGGPYSFFFNTYQDRDVKLPPNVSESKDILQEGIALQVLTPAVNGLRGGLHLGRVLGDKGGLRPSTEAGVFLTTRL